MNRDSIDWLGPMPAITTPFNADFSLDESAFRTNALRLYEAGSTGLVVGGCTGEFWSLTLAERARLARWAADVSAGRGVAIMGTGAIRAEEVIEQIHAARDAGCDGVLVLPPYFARLTESEIIAHYERIDAEAALPIVLYNIPGNAGNAITPAIADRLADLDKVVAIKESSGDWTNFHDTLLRVRDRIRVFCGPSSVFGVAATLAGSDGLIDCFPNVWTPGCLDLWYATREERMEEAWALQRTGLAMTQLFTAEGRTLYPSTKAVMDFLGLAGGGPPRPPLLPLEGSQRDSLIAGFTALTAGEHS
ncbi:MAG: dihydrodipicolinate synthase family protein [Halieaceae bacterium]|jgi:4-hydroxy-tetrahydrodipicolinate synthase|nr:dihydrodipicolinate synthase family protein [Halieaceae bacterium]